MHKQNWLQLKSFSLPECPLGTVRKGSEITDRKKKNTIKYNHTFFIFSQSKCKLKIQNSFVFFFLLHCARFDSTTSVLMEREICSPMTFHQYLGRIMTLYTVFIRQTKFKHLYGLLLISVKIWEQSRKKCKI